MQATIHTDPGVFVSLAEEWQALAAADPSATIFHLPEYLGIWWQEFGSKCTGLHLVELRDGPMLAGLAALALYPDGVARFVGDPDVTDYLGPVSRVEDRQVIAAAVLEEAVRLGPGSPVELHALASDSGWPEAFELAAKAADLTATPAEQDACPRVSLEGGWEGYLASLPGKLRHEIRRKDRRLRDAGPVSLRTADASTIDADLEIFFRFTRDADEEKSEFFQHHARASFFSALGAALLNHGITRLVVLELDGEPVAVDLGFSRAGTWSLYNMAYDLNRRELSPGMVLVGETIRLAAEEGCTTFDLLRGREGYKYRFGATDVPVMQLVVG